MSKMESRGMFSYLYCSAAKIFENCRNRSPIWPYLPPVVDTLNP